MSDIKIFSETSVTARDFAYEGFVIAISAFMLVFWPLIALLARSIMLALVGLYVFPLLILVVFDIVGRLAYPKELVFLGGDLMGDYMTVLVILMFSIPPLIMLVLAFWPWHYAFSKGFALFYAVSNPKRLDDYPMV